MENRQSIKTLLKSIGVVAFVVMLIYFLFLNIRDVGDLFREVKKMSPMMVGIFLLISFFNFFVFTAKWDIILRTASWYLPLMKLVWYRSVAFAVSYITPSAQVGGEPFRIYFLEKEGVPRTTAVSTVLVDKVFEFVVFTFFSVLAVALVLMRGESASASLVATLGLITAILGWYLYMTIRGPGFFTWIFRVFHLAKFHVLRPFEEKIEQTESMMLKFFQGHKTSILTTFLYTLAGYVFIVLEYACLLFFLGEPMSITKLLIISTIPMLGYATPVPGSVGTLEIAQWTAFQLAGIDTHLVVPTIVCLRVRDILFILIGMGYASTHGIHMLKKGKESMPISPLD